MIDIIDTHDFGGFCINVKILLWTCIMMEFKEFVDITNFI